MVAATVVVSTRRLRPDRNHNLIDVAGHDAIPSQFRPEPPISLESKEWATDYNETKSILQPVTTASR
jgi:hypothetical protein